jgi:hypothetical protein
MYLLRDLVPIYVGREVERSLQYDGGLGSIFSFFLSFFGLVYSS